ncbi:zinc metallochaperone AztD [Serinicoccus kebangsaanensis]|uniref:zinc metallochaperone AztD n=1 Tax=Serinicoccus kebangsaanensis TaxID=2602069 RepID=UPI001EE2F819|nr:zinc metallochaperone AztD [Serinicoccus kebangsaanensis]
MLTLALTSSMLVACGPTTSDDAGGADDNAPATSSQDDTPEEAGTADLGTDAAEDPEAAATVEAAGPTPRLAVTYDGGVLVLDALSLEVEADLEAAGFTRLNPAGDGRHLFLTEGDAFRLLDAGTWSEPHGNHSHSYTTNPALTDLAAEGSHPGHVVRHAGRTALYFDGAGRIDLVDPAELDGEAGELPVDDTLEVEDPHHGVAVLLEDGSLLQTVGTEEERSGAVVTDADGEQLAVTDECPGVHGETVAEGGAVVLGCEDGPVIYADGAFTKAQSPDGYGRVGNVAGTELSHVVLGDYKVDEDAELERPERVSLTDTETGELQLVDLGTSYSFRSLGRGPQGEALVLGTDGELHVIDPATGEITDELSVVEPWEEPEEWQEPRPTLFVHGQFGYVSEPASNELHIVDLDTMQVIDSASLPEQPNELSGVSGDVEAGHEGEGHDHEDHDHEDHDHEEEEPTS